MNGSSILALALGFSVVSTVSSKVEAAPAWHEDAKLSITTSQNSDYAATCVAASSDTVVLGAYGAALAGAGADAGAAYVFSKSGGTWTFTQKFAPSDLAAGAGFGTSCAMTSEYLVVGARGTSAPGAAYVYARRDGTWVFETKLTASDPEADDHFGISVAIDGATVVVGAENKPASDGWGAAYVFNRSSPGWSAPQKLVANDPSPNANFGWSVATSGATLLVGAIGRSEGRGGIYVFTKGDGPWAYEQVLAASDGAFADQLGISLALRGNTMVTGASTKDAGKGAAYAFTRAAGTWTERKLLVPNLANGDELGRAVNFVEDAIFVGASNRNAGAGSVFVFQRGIAGWGTPMEITASDARPGAMFGFALAADAQSGVVAVGAPGFNGARGQGYALRHALSRGESCVSTSECISGFCVDGVCCESACGGGDPSDCKSCSKASGSPEDGICGAALPSVLCRKANSECDVSEHCDGISTSCPADAVVANGTACHSGACIGGQCVDAASPTTPADASSADASSGIGAAAPSGCSCESAPRSSNLDGGAIASFGVACALALARLARALRTKQTDR